MYWYPVGISPGLRPPLVCQDFQTGRPLRPEEGPSPRAVSPAAAPAWTTASAGPAGTEVGPGLGGEDGAIQSPPTPPDQGWGLPTDATRCLWTLGPLWPELPLSPPWTCGLATCCAHVGFCPQLGGCPGLTFQRWWAGGEAMPCEQERGSRQKGQARSTDHQGAALRVMSRPTPIHGPPSLACSAWQGPRVVPCSASQPCSPSPWGVPHRLTTHSPGPLLLAQVPSTVRDGWTGTPLGHQRQGKLGSPSCWKRNCALRPGLRSMPGLGVGRGGGAALRGACLLSALGKDVASESPTATSAPWLPREGPPHPCGHLPWGLRTGPPFGFTTAWGLQKTLFAGRVLK